MPLSGPVTDAVATLAVQYGVWLASFEVTSINVAFVTAAETYNLLGFGEVPRMLTLNTFERALVLLGDGCAHFSLLVLDRRAGVAQLWDSMRGTHRSLSNRVLSAVKRVNLWSNLPLVVTEADVPQQGPGSGCGIWVGLFAFCLCHKWFNPRWCGFPLLDTTTELQWREDVE